MKTLRIETSSPEGTIACAKAFARTLKPGDIIFLSGELGAGKTTFTKGLALGLNIKGVVVNSPTFILMNHYEGKCPIYHFDFYRIQKPQELLTVDLEDYFYGRGVTVIEWPERLGEAAPKEFFKIALDHRSENERSIVISAVGASYQERLKNRTGVFKGLK